MQYVKSPERKSQAFLLRREGKSYAEICLAIGVPKSTLSDWLKDVEFSKAVKQDRLVQAKVAWAKNIREHNAKRHERYVLDKKIQIDNYAATTPRITRENLFFLVMGLFWGEGTKKSHWDVRIANSDPDVIRMMLRFFREECGITEEKFSGWVHTHKNLSFDHVADYWVKITGISREKIRVRAYVSVASRGLKPKNLLPYGTFHLRAQSPEVMTKIHGWLKGLRSQSMKPV